MKKARTGISDAGLGGCNLDAGSGSAAESRCLVVSLAASTRQTNPTDSLSFQQAKRNLTGKTPVSRMPVLGAVRQKTGTLETERHPLSRALLTQLHPGRSGTPQGAGAEPPEGTRVPRP